MSAANGMQPVADGLGRSLAVCLVHDDGHVRMAAAASMRPLVARTQALCGFLTAAGVKGWRIERMTLSDAVNAQKAALACTGCVIALECGCSIPVLLAGRCKHAGAVRLHRLAHVTGYCSNDSPGHGGLAL